MLEKYGYTEEKEIVIVDKKTKEVKATVTRAADAVEYLEKHANCEVKGDK